MSYLSYYYDKYIANDNTKEHIRKHVSTLNKPITHQSYFSVSRKTINRSSSYFHQISTGKNLCKKCVGNNKSDNIEMYKNSEKYRCEITCDTCGCKVELLRQKR